LGLVDRFVGEFIALSQQRRSNTSGYMDTWEP
jgi:hypothetical protein